MDSLKKLVALTSLTGKEWCVYSYILNNDDKEELKGLFFILGCFDTYQNAEKHVFYIIEQTGCNRVGIARYSAAIELKNNNEATEVAVDLKGKIIKFENQMFEEEKKRAEQKKLRDQEMIEECERECDVNHIEHFKRNVYLTLKHLSMIDDYQNKIEELKILVDKRKSIVADHYLNYPTHETEFLPY